MTHATRLLAAVLGSLLLATPLAATTPAAQAADSTIPLPHDDPFYAYDGSTPLAQQPAGAVLDSRSVTLKVGSTVPMSATQLLYRTQDELGRPSVTVTTVVAPLNAAPLGVVSYLSFYDALGDVCSPSYTYRTGDDSNEMAIVSTLVAQGYAVTIPDFEGEDLHWVAGHEAGWSTLDSIRATESFLGVSAASTRVGLFGYSGGSIAGEWASELAASYAPELNIVGTAIGGIPVHLAHNLAYIDGSQTWSGVIPAALVALARAYEVDLGRYESDYGKELAATVADQCIGSFNGNYPGLTASQLIKPGLPPLVEIPAATRILNRLIMGSEPGHPTMPMFMVAGDHDGTGDDVMIVGDVQGLAHEYCSEGTQIQMQVVEGAEHGVAGVTFLATGETWLLQRMAGVPMVDGCSSIPEGNSLDPLPVKPLTFSASLSAHDHGKRKDALTVTAPSWAAGAPVTFYRGKGRHRRVVGRGTLSAAGTASRVVRDRNGRTITRYVAVVGATADTKAVTTKRVKRR
ncbi:MAG: lipase family protein [Nocardioides sp.]|uniref:lipase family protein n=1 Tax=Nocardioides sp. TaxID=35761 RepID=UPI0039E69E13